MRFTCVAFLALIATRPCWASSGVELSSGFIIPEDMEVYITERGDNLQSVAQAFYGNPNHWPDVYQANRERIGKAGKMKKGTILLVPKNWVEPSPEVIPKAPPPPASARISEKPKKMEFKKKESSGPKIYTVQEGDNLESIAGKELEDPNLWKEIYQANKDKVDRGRVEPGDVLIIPAKIQPQSD